MTDLVRYQPPTTSLDLAPSAWKLAEKIASTDFVPTALRGKPEAVLACILTGHELGIGPMQALSKIHIIEGRPAMAAELMRATVLQHGHEINYAEASTTSVTAEGRRKGSDRWTKVTWTMDDARRGGLDGKTNWRKWPRAMLIARATAELCRMIFPDVLAGISYTVEELSDGDGAVELDLGPAEQITATATTPKKATAKANKAITRGPAVADNPDTVPAPRGELPDLPGMEPAEAELVEEDTPETETESADDIVDADVVEPSAEGPIEGDDWTSGEWDSGDFPIDTTSESAQKRYTGPQLIAIALAERFGIKGNSDDARKQRLAAIGILLGREITSSKDLEPAEVTKVKEAISSWPEDRSLFPEIPAATVGSVSVGEEVAVAPSVEPNTSSTSTSSPAVEEAPRRRSTPNPETWGIDQWRAFLVERKVKVTETLREAHRLGALRTPPVTIGTLDDMTGSGLASELVGWIEDVSLDRSSK